MLLSQVGRDWHARHGAARDTRQAAVSQRHRCGKRIVKHNKYKYVLVALDSAELTEELLRKQTDSVYLKHKQMPGWLACRLDKHKFFVRYAQK